MGRAASARGTAAEVQRRPGARLLASCCWGRGALRTGPASALEPRGAVTAVLEHAGAEPSASRDDVCRLPRGGGRGAGRRFASAPPTPEKCG